MFCNGCGKQIPDNSAFCPACGKPFGANGIQPNGVQPNMVMNNQPPKKKMGAGKVIAIVLGVFVLIGVIGSMGGEDTSTNPPVADGGSAVVETTPETTPATPVKEEAPVNVEYVVTTAKEMMDDLDNNALAAEKKWQDKYVEVSGALNTIDSDGSYITLAPADTVITIDGKKSVMSFLDLQCYIKDDAQLDKVLTMRTGEIYTIKGKVTSIGEVIGYQIDITEIR